MQTLLPETLKTAVPICDLREPEPMHIAVFESFRENVKASLKNEIDEKLAAFEAMIAKFEIE
jgi:hypothetical protein